MSLRLLSVSAAALFLAATTSPAAAQDAAVEAQAVVIRDQAMRSNIALDYVTQVTTRFGARPAGSRAEQQAAAWAADYMRAHGFQNVRIEEFPLIGWERGQSSGEVLGEHPQALVLAALGHSPATPRGGVEGEVVRFTSLEELQATPAGSLVGKIAYVDFGQMRPMQDGSGYGPQTRVRGAGPGVAAAKGAAAFVMRSVGSDEDRMPHTGTTRYVDGKPTIPSFALAAPDADQVSRLVAMGEPVRLRLTSTARTYETRSQNVIGDLPGAARPDEVIVYSAHWDHIGVGGDHAGGEDTIFNGAWDNASGTIGVLEMARELSKAPRPERTIVFAHMAAEEMGLLGAYAYVADPVYPLETTVADINIDMLPFTPATRDVAVFGVGKSELEDILGRFAAVQGRVVTGDGYPEEGFYYRSDHFPFARAGVPALMPWHGVDFVDGGKEAGWAAWRERFGRVYHQPSDEWSADWDLTSAVENLTLLYRLGLNLANGDEWPTWKPTSEFGQVRARSEAARSSR